MEYVCIVVVSPFMTRPEGSYDNLTEMTDASIAGASAWDQALRPSDQSCGGERALLQEYELRRRRLRRKPCAIW